MNYNNIVSLNNQTVSYGICLFNKWAGFRKVVVKSYISPDSISRAIYEDSVDNDEYHTRLYNLSKRLMWYVSIHSKDVLSLSLKQINELNMGEHKKLLHKLPNNPYIGQHVYTAVTKRIYDEIPDHHHLKKLTKIKVSKTQLSRLIGAIGYVADDQNMVAPEPIRESVFNGLSPDLFFQTAQGTRKGIVDKSRATPDSGYLERSLVINLSPIELDMDDCGTKIGLRIEIQSKEHAHSLIRRYYHDYEIGQDILYQPRNLQDEIGKVYIFKSPITCCNPDFKICRKCFGDYNITTPNVGILAGQYIAERLTQLSMRTFHTSGSCTIPVNDRVVDILEAHIKDIQINPDQFKQFNGIKDASVLILSTILEDQDLKLFQDIHGYVDFFILDNDTYMLYLNTGKIMNYDVTQIIRSVNEILRKQVGKKIEPITDTYAKFIKNTLSVGTIYSSFVELVLCNMYLTKDDEILRYALQRDINSVPFTKLSIKKLHRAISKLLGLLYEPNEISINGYDTNNNIPQTRNTILEQLWSNMI